MEKLDNMQYQNVLSVELVAAYVRVSTQEQKLHGLSLDAQKMKLTEYAEKHNMRIVEWYVDEGVSGRKLIKNRPELQRMIQDAEKGKFERIIFIKLDRFFRSVAEYHECMKRIAPVIWSTTEEEYDLTTANGRMLVNMKLTIAEMEADQTGERINIVNEYKLTTGQPLTGSMPFGFMISKDETTGRKRVVRDPDEEPILRDAIDHFITHQNKKKTVVYLQNKHHVQISYNSFSTLLENTMLCGEYRGNKDYCEAYMTREEFDRIQEILTRNVKCNTQKRDYIFSGLIKCPHCGRKLAGSITLISRSSGKSYRYKTYRCNKHIINDACDFKKRVAENVIERQLLENIGLYVEDAKIRDAKISDDENQQTLGFNVDDVNEEIDRLNYSWKTGKIRTVEQYEKDYEELMQKLDQAENHNATIGKKDFSKTEDILKNGWREIYNALDDAHKRSFWRSFVKSIDVTWTTEDKRINRVDFF